MKRLLDTLRAAAAPPDDPAVVERTLHKRFRFLEERQGFELAESSRLEDGAVAAYANRPARRSVAIFARRTKGAWAGIGTLAEDGRIPPVNRETVGRGVWREVKRVDIENGDSLEEALDTLAASLGGTRA